MSPEPSAKNSGETTPPLTTLDVQAGVSGGSPEQEISPPARQLDILDQPTQRQQQVQHGTPGDEKNEEASENEKEPAAGVTAKESDGTRDGSFDDDGNARKHPAVSCTPPANTTTASSGRGVLVPTLPLGSSNTANGDRDEKEGRLRATAVAEADRKPYSLAWAGGRKGRSLMKTVEDVLSDWFCLQEAKVGN